jgi:hypothetical protein
MVFQQSGQKVYQPRNSQRQYLSTTLVWHLQSTIATSDRTVGRRHSLPSTPSLKKYSDAGATSAHICQIIN